MSKVRRLDADLANQIAAGEVVERPASVVKELVENALDAGATRVRVDLEQGGLARISVNDDGDGMTPDDAMLAIERHATSKIARIDDLMHLHTFGFRGEALPSIASVSHLTLTTRAREAAEGVELVLHGGGAPRVRPVGCARGTTVRVEELFFNVPARRKFVKSVGTESAHAGEVILLAALARPDVSFSLSRDGKVAKEHLRAASRRERVGQALSEERLETCTGERGPMRLEAYLAPPERARAGAGSLHIFVNGRPVRDRALARAVAQAYGSVLEPGRYPVGVLYVELPPDLVDVNVHPQKAEVRFADGRAVFDAVTRELHAAAARAFAIPAVGPMSRPWQRPASPPAALSPFFRKTPLPFTPPTPHMPSLAGATPPRAHEDAAARAPAPPTPAVATPRTSPSPAGSIAPPDEPAAAPSAPDVPRARPSTAELDDAPTMNSASYALLHRASPALPLAERVVDPDVSPPPPPQPELFERRAFYGSLVFLAQVRATFLVCEGEDGLYILDQHAAAERVTFDRLRRGFASREIASQKLLIPEVIEVGAKIAEALEEHAAEVEAVGLDVRSVGPGAVAVHAVPKILARAKPERLVRDLAAELTREAVRPFGGAADLVLATMACHGSVRAGDRMAPDEVAALLEALDAVDFSGHCPHGRPVITRLPFGELERKVGR